MLPERTILPDNPFDQPQDRLHDPMDEKHAPPGARKGVRKAVYLAIALLVMFLLAIGISSTSIGVLKRPGADPGAFDKAPAD